MRFTCPFCSDIVVQAFGIASGLNYLHGIGVIHADIKSVSLHDNVKVIFSYMTDTGQYSDEFHRRADDY